MMEAFALHVLNCYSTFFFNLSIFVCKQEYLLILLLGKYGKGIGLQCFLHPVYVLLSFEDLLACGHLLSLFIAELVYFSLVLTSKKTDIRSHHKSDIAKPCGFNAEKRFFKALNSMLFWLLVIRLEFYVYNLLFRRTGFHFFSTCFIPPSSKHHFSFNAAIFQCSVAIGFTISQTRINIYQCFID